MPFSKARAVEVTERDNYTHEQFDTWALRYGLTSESRVIWVTDIHTVSRYGGAVCNVTGRIIEESNDGDNGFLMIITKKEDIVYI